MTTPSTANRKAIGGGIAALVIAVASTLVLKWEPAPRDKNLGYWDALGNVATACYGHTGGVVVGKRYTDAQCNAWQRQDMSAALATVNRCIHVELTAGQGAALVDATYNLGPAIVCGSTLQRLANSGAPGAVWCQQLKRWNRASGRELTGLTHRRADELALCLK